MCYRIAVKLDNGDCRRRYDHQQRYSNSRDGCVKSEEDIVAVHSQPVTRRILCNDQLLPDVAAIHVHRDYRCRRRVAEEHSVRRPVDS